MTHTAARPSPRRTRGMLLTPLVALTLIIGLIVGLEAIHPQVDLDEAGVDLAVTDVPALAIDDVRPCIRRADEANVAAIRTAIPGNGRVSSVQVHACPMAYDGLRVTYVGEVIGELIRRDGGVWVQVNDDDYALEVGPVIGHREHRGFNTGLSVWLPDPVHTQIAGVGRAGQRGDVVAVSGILHQADPDDGGGITVRATSLEILAPAVTIDAPFHLIQALVAATLAMMAAAAIIWARWTRTR